MKPPASEARPSAPSVLRTLLVAAVVGLGVFLLGWMYEVLLALFAGLLLGVFLHGVARFLAQKTRFPYRAVVATLTVLLLALGVAFTCLIGPALGRQVDELVKEIPAAESSLEHMANGMPFIRPLLKSSPAGPVGSVGPVMGAAASALRVGFEAIAGLFVAIVAGIYGAFDPSAYERAVLRLVAPQRRDRARQVLERMTRTLLRWICGRILMMILVGVLTTLGLWIAGVPLAFSLGLLAGVLTFVPYLGVLLSIVPAALVALAKSPWTVVWVLVVFTIAHGLEGYVFSPLVAKRTVEFPPAFTIGAQVLLGAIWGVLGFAFAMPIAVVLTILVDMLYVEDILGDYATGD